MWTYKEHYTFTVVECGIKSNLPSGAGCLQMHFCFASLLRRSVCHRTSVCYCLMDIYVPSGTYFHLICHTWGPHNLKPHIQSVFFSCLHSEQWQIFFWPFRMVGWCYQQTGLVLPKHATASGFGTNLKQWQSFSFWITVSPFLSLLAFKLPSQSQTSLTRLCATLLEW